MANREDSLLSYVKIRLSIRVVPYETRVFHGEEVTYTIEGLNRLGQTVGNVDVEWTLPETAKGLTVTGNTITVAADAPSQGVEITATSGDFLSLTSGIWRLFNYTGTLIDNGLTLDSLPALKKLMKKATTEFKENGRHLIRYSGSENKIRVLVEHRDIEECRIWVSKFAAVIRDEIG